jgi:hypothetical protein
MSKDKTPDPSDAEDYLNRLNWQSKNPYRRTPWYLMPKWKYKPTLQINGTNPTFSRILFIGVFLLLVAYLGYSIIAHQSGFSVFLLVVVLIIAAILYLALRDAQGTFKDDD